MYMNSNIMKKKRIYIILAVIVALLLVPLIAMQFTDEVNWNFGDFAVMGVLLFITGFFFELVLRLFTRSKQRAILLTIIIAICLLIWAELAVGIFGTPFSGS